MLALAGAAPPAAGQALDPYLPAVSLGADAFRLDTVQSRSRSEFDDKGITLGDTVIRPLLEESAGFDDNILGSHARQSSPEIRTRASLTAGTERARNNLSAGLTLDDVRYTAKPAQGYTDWTGSLGGSYDIGRNQASATYAHSSLHLQPSQIDNLVAGVPVPYVVDDVGAGYLADFGRVSLQTDLGYTRYRFARVVVNGLDAGSEFGNRDVGSGSLTGAYEFDTARKILVVLRSSYSAFTTGNGMPRRNNTGLTVLNGVDYTANGLVRYRFLLGYAERLYDSAAYKTIASPVAEGSVIWSPQRVTTVTLSASRRIEDAIDASVVGYTYTQADLTVDREIRRDLLAQARAGAQVADFARNAGTQTIYTVGGRLVWYLSRVARLTGDYALSFGRNPGGLADGTIYRGAYQRDVLLVSLRLQL